MGAGRAPGAARRSEIFTHATGRQHSECGWPRRLATIEVPPVALRTARAPEHRLDRHHGAVGEHPGELVPGNLPAPIVEVQEVGGTYACRDDPQQLSVTFRHV